MFVITTDFNGNISVNGIRADKHSFWVIRLYENEWASAWLADAPPELAVQSLILARY